jgi:hypothetical protein
VLLGTFFALLNGYPLSAKVGITGFPFPTAIFIEEDGHWVDYINNLMPLAILGNFVVGVGVPMILLMLVLLTLWMWERRVDAERRQGQRL